MTISKNHLTLTGNRFFDTLPRDTQAKLRPQLTLATMEKGRIIADPGVPCEDVIFPLHSIISTVTLTDEGLAVEVGLIGNEGISPPQLAFGSLASRHSTMVQVADSALRMNAKAFLLEYEADTVLRERCLRFAEYCFAASTQFAACNGVHPIEERYARWILMAADRVGAAEFYLTQEYSAMMLGVRRATVTTIALHLSSMGLISYKRGHIRVTDRDGLEDASCECYAAVNADLQRLLGYGFRDTVRSSDD